MISKRFAALTGKKRTVLYPLALLCCASSSVNAQVTFSAQTYSIGESPYHQVATGDFNDDGKPDVAVLSDAGGTVIILLNNGDGTFAPAVDFPALTPQVEFDNLVIRRIAVGDMNGDDRLDLMVTNPAVFQGPTTEASVNVLLGNGDGTFQRPISMPASISVFIGNLGDFNGDKMLDTLVYGPCCNAVTSLLGNGDSTFNIGTEVSGVGVASNIFADVNQDGKLDVVLSAGDFFFVLLGKGDGTFRSPMQVSSQAPKAFYLRTGDFDHNGKPDLLSSSAQARHCEFGLCRPSGPPGSVAVMLGNGDGTFGGPGVITNGDFGVPAAGDFDGDGNLDFAVNEGASFGSSGVFDFYLGNGLGQFAVPAVLTFAIGNGGDVAAADFNRDDLADLVLISSSAVQVALNTTPGFSLKPSPAGPRVPPGGSAAYTINVGQQNSFSETVTLSCSSPMSQGVDCSLSPSSVTPGGSSTLTVTTTAAVAGLIGTSGPPSGLLYALWLPFAGLVSGGIGFGFKQSPKAKLRTLLLGCVLGAGLIFQVACGGGSSNSSGGSSSGGGGTPPGSYTIVVSGTSGALQRSTAVTLTVQ